MIPKEKIDEAIVDILKSNFVQKNSYSIDSYWMDIAKAKEEGKQQTLTHLKEEIELLYVANPTELNFKAKILALLSEEGK